MQIHAARGPTAHAGFVPRVLLCFFSRQCDGGFASSADALWLASCIVCRAGATARIEDPAWIVSKAKLWREAHAHERSTASARTVLATHVLRPRFSSVSKDCSDTFASFKLPRVGSLRTPCKETYNSADASTVAGCACCSKRVRSWCPLCLPQLRQQVHELVVAGTRNAWRSNGTAQRTEGL